MTPLSWSILLLLALTGLAARLMASAGSSRLRVRTLAGRPAQAHPVQGSVENPATLEQTGDLRFFGSAYYDTS